MQAIHGIGTGTACCGPRGATQHTGHERGPRAHRHDRAAHRYQAALANVARRTRQEHSSTSQRTAVLAAQADDPLVIETLGLVAGLSWRDLQARSQARGLPLPGDSEGAWSPSQVTERLQGDRRHRVRSSRAPARRCRGRSARWSCSWTVLTGWGEVEKLRTGGVSYGTLLAQRDVGSAWSAHRNRSNNEISRLMVRRVLSALDDADVGYWSAEGDAAVAKSFLGRKAGVSGKPPGQLSVVTRGQDGAAGYAVLVAIARDGGTARKTAATLLQLPKRFTVPAVLVLFGTGWADRGESDDLVRAYGGRLYTEHTLTDLARLAAAVGGG